MPTTHLLKTLQRLPIFGRALLRLILRLRQAGFKDSASYWQNRYSRGGTSGLGSCGSYAQFKANVVNDFVKKRNIVSVIEFGCGDGNQLSLMRYPNYVGLDVSPTAIDRCRAHFAGDDRKQFFLYEPSTLHRNSVPYRAELGLSLDVIYHLVEDDIYERYMAQLFSAATKYVIVFSSDTDDNPDYAGPHLKHRQFSRTIGQTMPNWQLLDRIPNTVVSHGQSELAGAPADFYIYHKRSDRPV
jgi:SAM-dependent methyltransferase